ncbi:OLC1v1016194C1 [Oldenlandia corymbosa var. corymbosa]|uniref:OLC1v1016194C1 n=1 Tax=Oldenlandia corymbosa var. corymbosa TaxID=529605 RepID=A0AAV1E5F5_OLDCO|nr:OLC1v1016194C1 [Oldenlandia corymbosa var. corymbosa]
MALNLSCFNPPTISPLFSSGRQINQQLIVTVAGSKREGSPAGLVVVAKSAAGDSGGGTSGSGVGKYKGTLMREKQLTEMIEKKVMEAKQVCGDDLSSDECRVAWDEVEEVSQAKADLRLKLEVMHQDPLESFCQENPETDECRLYED